MSRLTRTTESGHAGRRRSAWWWPLAALAVVAGVVVSAHGALGGFSAAVANTGDNVRTGTLITAATTGSTSECDLSSAAYNPITAANTAPCTGGLLATGTLPVLGSSSQSTSVTDKGSLNATGASLVAGTCGAVQLTNSVANDADPMLVRGATPAYAQTGPLSGSTGLGLGGTTGYASDIAGVVGPTTTSFTEAIWFKATVAGTIFGDSNTPTTTPVSWDKMLWVDNTGHVVFAVYPVTNIEYELTSTGTYLDGNWHLIVAGVSTTAGASLRVDNAAAVTNAAVTTAQSYTSYWHVGWENEAASWADAPTNAYFTGTVADAAVLPVAPSNAMAVALYSASSQAVWTSLVTSTYAATYAWSLGDSPVTTAPYVGAIPGGTLSTCAFVDATVQAATTTTTCAAPASASACTPTTSTVSLASLASKTTSFAVYPTTTQPLVLTTTVARDTLNTTTLYGNAVGLHVTMPLSVVCATSGFTATLTWPVEDVIL